MQCQCTVTEFKIKLESHHQEPLQTNSISFPKHQIGKENMKAAYKAKRDKQKAIG